MYRQYLALNNYFKKQRKLDHWWSLLISQCTFDYLIPEIYPIMDSNKTAGEEARWQLHKNAVSNLEQVLVATPHKTRTVRPPASYHKNYSS